MRSMRVLERIWLDRSSTLTLQDQIARGIKELIQQGVLSPGEALPSTRDLAAGLEVSRNTVVYAYDRLISEGYAEPRLRSGVFVSSSLPHGRGVARPAPAKGAAEAPIPAPRVLGPPRPFRPCQPDVTLFPLLVWNRLRGRVLRADSRNLLHYQASCNSGLPALREVLASYLRDNRSVRCDWRQIVITSGSQQALYILANLLLSPGDHVYMEDPGYNEARQAWRSTGARVVPGPVDAEGLRLPSESGKRPSLIYTTPSRQFPTGASLSLPRRLALIDQAHRLKSWIIEDDYDSELRYRAAPLPSLQSLDPSGRVIYVGTFSKLLFPSLRLGYVVVPDALRERFDTIKHLIDDHLPLLDQATLAHFLESGAFFTHIRRCRSAYAERQALFLKLFRASDLPFEFPYTDGGMNLAGFLPAGTDDERWSGQLREQGLDVPSLAHYSSRPGNPGLVFGFTAFTPSSIRHSFERMRGILAPLS